METREKPENFCQYDYIVVNSSGGKDSVVALWKVVKMAMFQGYSLDRILVSHQELGDMEWSGTKELVQKQCDFLGVECVFTKRRDRNGYEENLLEYVERRGKWPSNTQRYCTSDFKRGPGMRVVTALTKGIKKSKILYVFGFRKDESPARAKKKSYSINKNLTTNSRKVFDWLPILDWSTERIWKAIRMHNLPYHYAYDLGMPRLSCVFCIFSPMDALVVAGRANPELLDRYIEVENKIGHDFRHNFKIASVKEKIESGYSPKAVENWVM